MNRPNNNNAQTLQESIRSQAYLLSEEAGHPDGMAEFFWFKAEALVMGGNGASTRRKAPSKNSAAKPKAKAVPKSVPTPLKSGKTGGEKVLAIK